MAGIAVMKDNVKLYLAEEQTALKTNKVGRITQIGDIGGEAEEIDTTCIDSLAKENVNGFDDNGTLEITQNLTSDEYKTMYDYKEANKELFFGLSVRPLPVDMKVAPVLGLQGKANVKSIKLTGISVGGLVQVNTSLKITGAVTPDFDDKTSG